MVEKIGGMSTHTMMTCIAFMRSESKPYIGFSQAVWKKTFMTLFIGGLDCKLVEKIRFLHKSSKLLWYKRSNQSDVFGHSTKAKGYITATDKLPPQLLNAIILKLKTILKNYNKEEDGIDFKELLDRQYQDTTESRSNIVECEATRKILSHLEKFTAAQKSAVLKYIDDNIVCEEGGSTQEEEAIPSQEEVSESLEDAEPPAKCLKHQHMTRASTKNP